MTVTKTIRIPLLPTLVRRAREEVMNGDNGLSHAERQAAYDILTEWLAANPPKIRPEDQPAVPVAINEAELGDLNTGMYLFGCIDKFLGDGWIFSEVRYDKVDTHVVYIEMPKRESR